MILMIIILKCVLSLEVSLEGMSNVLCRMIRFSMWIGVGILSNVLSVIVGLITNVAIRSFSYGLSFGYVDASDSCCSSSSSLASDHFCQPYFILLV